jgi:hypothetical protein
VHFLRGGQDGKPALNGEDGLEAIEDSNIGHTGWRWWSEREAELIVALFFLLVFEESRYKLSLSFFSCFFKRDAIPMLHMLVYM